MTENITHNGQHHVSNTVDFCQNAFRKIINVLETVRNVFFVDF